MKLKNRACSLLLAICMVFSCVVLAPIQAHAATSARSDGYVSLDGIHLNYDNVLTEVGDGTYHLKVRAETTFEMEDTNRHSLFSENGFYVAEKAGKYLVELWGGDGATVSPAGSAPGSGGAGGKGGRVYGIVNLQAGDVLYYALGGNGQKTNVVGVGGGVNGSGGTHGGAGNTTVGGGGGYSAVFLYEGDEFEKAYLDANGDMKVDSITEADRISKYIMIAGGGGGGGAYSMDSTGLPNGGAGGSIGDTSGVLSGSAYDVEGTFFAGHDGMSSGNSTSFVGRGGTNVPGRVEGSILGLTDGEKPNDWKGTNNPNLAGGAGGAGNLRGGSGGAGFCGGSGGLMASFIVPTDVGGGGGGSSFLSELVRYELNATEQAALVHTNTSTTGGAVCITYLEEEDISYLSDLTFRFNTTEYFSVLDARVRRVSDSTVIEAVPDGLEGDSEYVFRGVSVLIGEPVEFDFIFEPMADFAGGNRVPIFAHERIYVSTPDNNAHGEGAIRLYEECAYVNVPLNFTVRPINHNTNHAGHEHPVKELYEDDYADVRGDLGSHWQYDFIASIGEYTVTDLHGNVLSGTVAPTETTKYIVGFTVTPKNEGVAAVGTPVAVTHFTDVATVTVEGSNIEQLNGNWVTYYKSIDYSEELNMYCLTLRVKSDTNRNLEEIPQPPEFNFSSSGAGSATQVQTTEIEYSGYYYLQLWGGKGGKGGQSAWFGSAGGDGGDGGYVGGYFYLQKGQVLHVHIGKNGTDGDNGTGFLAAGKGGTGGEPSAVALLKTDPETGIVLTDANNEPIVDKYILIAGGGSGGSGGWGFQSSPGLAPTTTQNEIPSTVSNLEAVIANYSGNTGPNGASGSAAAGVNAYDKTIFNQNDPRENNDLSSDVNLSGFVSGDYANAGGGAFHLTYIQLDTAPDGQRAESLAGYEIELALAKYFTLPADAKTAVRVVDHYSGLNLEGVSAEMLSDDPNYSHIEFDNIHPTQKEYTLPNGDTYKSVDFTIHVHVQPHSEFIGGNDVMLLDVTPSTVSGTGLKTGMRFGQVIKQGTGDGEVTLSDTFDVLENSRTDYVNVPINWPAIEGVLTTRNKVHLVDESDPVSLSQLYRIDGDAWSAIQAAFPTDWRADYAELKGPVITDGSGVAAQTDSETKLAPEVTTTYTLSIGVYPKTPSYYADVVEEAVPVVDAGTVIIYAAHRVTYDLDAHITHNSLTVKDLDKDYPDDLPVIYIAEVGKDYEVTLQVTAGDYSLPDTVTVKRGGSGGETLVQDRDYTYSVTSEKIVIPAAVITDELYINAETTADQYTLHYIVQTLEDGLPSNGYVEYAVPMWAGDPINADADCAAAIAMAGISTDIVGHTFRWDWGDGSETPPDVMPVQDWWVFGRFTPNSYTVVIRYVDENGNTLAPSHSATYAFGDTVNVISPGVDHYTPALAAYTATVDAALIAGAVGDTVTVEVVYTSIQNELILQLMLENGTVADSAKVRFDFGTSTYTVTSPNGYTYGVTASFGADAVSYTVTLPHVVGHHTASATLTGTLSQNGGQTVQIDYLANRYRLVLDADGGSCAVSERTVVYGMPYNFNDGTYEGLPNAIRVGAEFLGWAKADVTPVTMIKETDTVTLDAENGSVITLRAQWDAGEFTVQVRYELADGTPIPLDGFEERLDTYKYGDTYTYTAPALSGYTATPGEYSGIIPAQNLVLTFTYYVNDVVDAISVSVSWGTLTYTATPGAWDPEGLVYGETSFDPDKAGENTVTVTNSSDATDIVATLHYTMAAGYESIDGYFTATDERDARKNSQMDLEANGGEDTRYVWLEGDIPESMTGGESAVCGTVKVTVAPKS
ncbi:MAG: hypothetical protein E7644_06710 [Ruminococcaceae bacterium]|nr:hypothetical protein [Oscillospiraceae bacterium]